MRSSKTLYNPADGLGEALADADGLTLPDGEALLDADLDALAEGEAEADGLPLGLAEGLALLLGEREALGDFDAD
ncbi:MAG: hypothetical protein AAB706_04400 [Patescibacteria group bacterium]